MRFHLVQQSRTPTLEFTPPGGSCHVELIKLHDKHAPAARVQRFVGLPVRSNGHSSGWISVFSKIQPLGQVSPTATAHFWSLSAGAPRVSAHLRQRAIVKDHHVQPRKPPIARNNQKSRSSMKAPTNNTPRI